MRWVVYCADSGCFDGLDRSILQNGEISLGAVPLWLGENDADGLPRRALECLAEWNVVGLERNLGTHIRYDGSKVSWTNRNMALGRRADYQRCTMAGTACLVSRRRAVISSLALRALIPKSMSFMTMLRLPA
jgi:hypothetical protein